jgi:hypothetical protein
MKHGNQSVFDPGFIRGLSFFPPILFTFVASTRLGSLKKNRLAAGSC